MKFCLSVWILTWTLSFMYRRKTFVWSYVACCPWVGLLVNLWDPE